MQYLLSIILLIQLNLSLSQSCPTTQCDNWSNDQCYEYQQATIMISSCPEGKICNVNRMYSTSALNFANNPGYCVDNDYVGEDRLPGEYCSGNDECRSKNCQGGICKGFSKDESCQFAQDCDVGLACNQQNNGFCKPQVSIGENCNTYLECLNNSGCFNGVCVAYFSLPNGSQFEKYNQNTNELLCQSGYLDASLTCSASLHNKKEPDYECTNDSDCKLSDDSDGRCLCGLNKNGSMYCKSQAGDQEFYNFKSTLNQLFLINGGCHTSICFSKRCPLLNATQEINNFLKHYYIYIYRHYLIGAEECTVNMVNPLAMDYEYVNTKSSASSDDFNLTVIIIAAVVVTSVILCCLFCLFVVKKHISQNLRPLPSDIQEERIEVLQISNTRLVKAPAFTKTSKFRVDDFELAPKSQGRLLVGVPIGMQIDSNTMEIRASETYPVAISDEQILIECLELDNSHSELKTPSSNFLSSRKKYTGLSNVTLNI